jgi:hypothetical protein
MHGKRSSRRGRQRASGLNRLSSGRKKGQSARRANGLGVDRASAGARISEAPALPLRRGPRMLSRRPKGEERFEWLLERTVKPPSLVETVHRVLANAANEGLERRTHRRGPIRAGGMESRRRPRRVSVCVGGQSSCCHDLSAPRCMDEPSVREPPSAVIGVRAGAPLHGACQRRGPSSLVGTERDDALAPRKARRRRRTCSSSSTKTSSRLRSGCPLDLGAGRPSGLPRASKQCGRPSESLSHWHASTCASTGAWRRSCGGTAPRLFRGLPSTNCPTPQRVLLEGALDHAPSAVSLPRFIRLRPLCERGACARSRPVGDVCRAALRPGPPGTSPFKVTTCRNHLGRAPRRALKDPATLTKPAEAGWGQAGIRPP